MKGTRLIRLATALLLLFPARLAVAQTSRSTYDPAGQYAPQEPRQGFVDFTLKRINPSDKDYGQCINEERKLILQETIQKGYFWSNLVSLGVLGCLVLIVLYQHRQRVRREWTVAEVLQQYEHALVRANAQIDEATKRNLEFMKTLSETREGTLRTPMFSRDRDEVGATSSGAKRAFAVQPAEATAAKAIAPSAVARVTRGGGDGTGAAGQMGLFKPEVDLILKVNSLEQQLGRSQEQERQLRRQLTQADQRLQAEQQKNRSLKGA